jgi:hypothetical protein
MLEVFREGERACKPRIARRTDKIAEGGEEPAEIGCEQIGLCEGYPRIPTPGLLRPRDVSLKGGVVCPELPLSSCCP